MHSLLRRIRGFSFSLTVVAALVSGAALLPPQEAFADPIVGSIVLNPEDISNFTLVGSQAPATGPQLLFADVKDTDISGLNAAAPWAAAGTTVDIIATFQVTSQAANGVDAGFQLVINDAANNRAAILGAILINNLPHIGLVGNGPRDLLASYLVFIQAEWQAVALTVHLRRWADGSFEVLELNGAPPSQRLLLPAMQLQPATRAFGSIEFGAFSPQAIVNASVSEFRAFTVPEPDTPAAPPGTPWAWGQNRYGQLGDGTTTQRDTPVQVSGLSGVIAIDGGGVHSLALKSDGTVWAWGNNGFGQLGDGEGIGT